MTSRLALAIAATFAALLLAACDGDSETPPAASASPAASATGPAASSPTATATGAATASPTASATATSESPSSTAAATATAASPATPSATPAATPTARPNDDVVASTASIPVGDLDLVEFTNSAGEVTTFPIEVPPRSEYSVGFSGRYSLAARGMLFHYDELRGSAFWMNNTHIDLAIAFVDDQLLIVDIREMVADSLDLIAPRLPYQYAIETPSGWFAERGIRAGDRVRFLFELPDE